MYNYKSIKDLTI